jgi:hypothetical protein
MARSTAGSMFIILGGCPTLSKVENDDSGSTHTNLNFLWQGLRVKIEDFMTSRRVHWNVGFRGMNQSSINQSMGFKEVDTKNNGYQSRCKSQKCLHKVHITGVYFS